MTAVAGVGFYLPLSACLSVFSTQYNKN